jgi:hypothetical protein
MPLSQRCSGRKSFEDAQYPGARLRSCTHSAMSLMASNFLPCSFIVNARSFIVVSVEGCSSLSTLLVSITCTSVCSASVHRPRHLTLAPATLSYTTCPHPLRQVLPSALLPTSHTSSRLHDNLPSPKHTIPPSAISGLILVPDPSSIGRCLSADFACRKSVSHKPQFS